MAENIDFTSCATEFLMEQDRQYEKLVWDLSDDLSAALLTRGVIRNILKERMTNGAIQHHQS